MNGKESYKHKILASAADFIDRMPRSGRLALGHAAAEPRDLVNALLQRYESLDYEIMHMVPMGPCRYTEEPYSQHLRHNSLFVGQSSRRGVAEGRADYTPVFFSEIPRFFRNKLWPLDVALISVSPPDAKGNCSFGVSVDYTEAIATHAPLVVAEINELMPRTHGPTINISAIDYIWPCERPLPELKVAPKDQVQTKIGALCADLIPDGACLQLGIGAIPDAVLAALEGKKDLGIHSEMFSDGVMHLYQKGVITGSRKALDRGKMVACFLMGSESLYRFVHENTDVLMCPADYTNAISVASAQPQLMAINSALEVDLFGQVAADHIGGKQFSSVGGQVDFVRAARASEGGRAIIALPSTAAGGKLSRIVPTLSPGSMVTTSRFDVDTIVSEWGVAELKGKTQLQRAKALVAIAHPDFRDGLEAAVRRM